MNTQSALTWLKRHHKFLHRPLLYLALISAVLSGSAVLFAYLTKAVVDAAELRDMDTFVIVSVVAALVMAVQLLFGALNKYLRAFYTAKTDQHLKNKVYAQLLKTKTPALEQHHSGTLMNHLTSDIEKVSEGLVEIFPRFVFLLLRFVFAFALMVFLDWLFGVIVLGVGLVLVLVSLTLRGLIKKRHHAVQDSEARLRAYMQEGLENVPVIKSFEAEEHTLAQLADRQDAYVHARLKRATLNVLTGSGLAGFFAFGYVFALIFGAYRITEGVITFGSLVALLQLVNHVQTPFSGLSTLIPKYYGMIASTERLMGLFHLPEEKSEPVALKVETFQQLQFKRVRFAYGSAAILDDFSATIAKGDFVLIKGHTGIGKTTVFKLLLGLVEPQKGTIELSCDDKAHVVSARTRAIFTYVPQNLMIFSGTIAANIRYNQTADHDAVVNAAKIAQIHADIIAMPNGYETQIGERGLGLSEGQVQRLAIARALLKNAPVLLFDEVTSALDAKTEAKILSEIRKLTDKTCLFISHRAVDADLVDTTIQL